MNEFVDIHADDYGYSMNTSKDILECIKAGKLNSFSIMSNMRSFDESMEMLYKEIPSFPFLPKIAIHINIPEGESESRSFPMSWAKLFLSSYSFDRNRIKEELKSDLKKQIEKGQAAVEKCIRIAEENGVKYEQKGMRLDSHIHTHLIPVVWDALIELVEEEGYDIEYIRNPKEPLLPFVKDRRLYKTYSPVNLIKNRILMAYSKKVDSFCDKNGIGKMYMWGLMMSGEMDFERIKTLYPDMLAYAEKRGRKLELLFHPGRAVKEEQGPDMDKDYFRDANLSENRSVEKNAVLRIDEIIGQRNY